MKKLYLFLSFMITVAVLSTGTVSAQVITEGAELCGVLMDASYPML